MRVAVMQPSGDAVWSYVDMPGLLDLPAMVGGYVERVPMPKSWGPGSLWCNEDGLRLGLKINKPASKLMCMAWVHDCFLHNYNPFLCLDPTRLQLYGTVVWCEQVE